MRSFKIVSALLTLFLGISQEGKAQKELDSVINYVFGSVAEQVGNLFVENMYLKADTSQLKRYYGESLQEEIAFVRTFKLSLKDWTPNYARPIAERARSRKQFFDEHDKNFPIPLGKDSSTFLNFENWDLKRQQSMSGEDSLAIYNLTLSITNRSSWRKRVAENTSKAAPKLLRILAIYESDEYYLVLYDLMLLQGYPHYYPGGELLYK
jgi:hypothetical protein